MFANIGPWMEISNDLPSWPVFDGQLQQIWPSVADVYNYDHIMYTCTIYVYIAIYIYIYIIAIYIYIIVVYIYINVPFYSTVPVPLPYLCQV